MEAHAVSTRPQKRPPQISDLDPGAGASRLPWREAVAAGVVTNAEADLLCECVGTDGRGTWHVNTTGLDIVHREALERAVRWFCSSGGVQ